MIDQSATDLYEEWLNNLPSAVRTIALAYPGDRTYRIKEGAPYAVSCPGTKVYVHSYGKDGSIEIVVMAEDKLPEAIAHEHMLMSLYMNKAYKPETSNIRVTIDPQWLEEIVEDHV